MLNLNRMKKLSLIQKCSISSFPILGLGLFILMLVFDIFIELNPVTLTCFILMQILFIFYIVFLYKRIYRLTNNKDLRNTQVLLMIFFYPYILYYVWIKDDRLISKYKEVRDSNNFNTKEGEVTL